MPIATNLKGTHQFTDVITDNIRNYAVTAIKLNPDVTGNGIELDDLNRISFTGYTIVKNESELLYALSSGNVNNIFLKDGVYNIGTSLFIEKAVSIVGENKKTTLISLSPSGQISLAPASGQIVNGLATLNTENLVTLNNLDVSGTMSLGTYAGASLIIDDIPYKVVSVVSGEVGGTSIVQLSEPFAGTSFTNKVFKLEYLLDFVVLKNLGFSSAYNDGIVKINQVRNLLVDSVEVRGSDVINNPSQGFNIQNTYFGSITNTDVTLTKVTLPLNETKEYALYLKDSRFISVENLNVYNTNSNGIYFLSSKYIDVTGIKLSEIDGNPLRINNCYSVSINSSLFKNFGLKSNIFYSDQVTLTNNTFLSNVDRQAIESTESHISLLNNNFFNTYVKTFNNTQEVIISSNEFENVVSTTNALYIEGKDQVILNGNVFNSTATNAVLIYSGNVAATNNYFLYSTNAINVQSASNVILSNNIVEQTTNGFVFDSVVTNSSINNNVFTVTGNAISILGTKNHVSSNTIISGSTSFAFGNTFPFLTTFEPVYSGSIDIGTNTKPVKDIYLSNAVRSKNIILNNGAIFGANNISLSGHIITVDASHLYIDGEDIAGLSLNDIQYVHNQIVFSSNWIVKHNLKTKNVSVTIFDETDQMVEPVTVSNIDANKVSVTFGTAIKGRAVVHSAGSKSTSTGITGQTYTHHQTSLAPIWTVSHNLQSINLIIQTYDENDEMYFPSTVKFIDNNTVAIYNSYAKKGRAVIFSESIFNTSTSQYIFRQNTSGTLWTIPHNRGSKDFVITTYDDPYEGKVFAPTAVTVSNENTIYVTNSTPKTGRAILIFPSANPQRFTDVKYTHEQGTISSTWDILHNLNTDDVSVVMYDSLGDQIFTGITYVKIVDPDYVQVQFTGAKSGKAIVLAPISSNTLTDLTTDIGDLSTLTTNNQSSVVNSLNEVHALVIQSDVNKNRIVNGDFIFSDEHGNYNSGVVGAGIQPGSYVGDIFKFNFSGSATIGWERTTDVPNTSDRSQYSIRFDVISGATLNTNEYYTFTIPLEGYKIADTYNSSTAFSFHAKTNKPGIYSLALRGSHSSSPNLTTYVTPFTIGGLNIWEKIEFVIPSDANWHSWNKDETLGLEINIVLSAGSGYLSVGDDAWYADNTTDYRSQAHDMDFPEFTNANLYITRLKYEKGSVVTNFIPGDVSDERRRMDRYYQILSGKNQVTTYSGIANDSMTMINHREEMRVMPSSNIRHVMVSLSGSLWNSGTVSIDTANKYNTTLYTSNSSNYRFVGGDTSYNGINNFVIHNKARF